MSSGRPLASLPFNRPQTPSSGFSSGAYGGKYSRWSRENDRSSCAKGTPRWVLLLSISAITWPRSWRRTSRRNRQTSSWPMFSQKNIPYRPDRSRRGLTESPEIAEMRSLRNWWRSSGVAPTGDHVLRTVGVSMKPDSSTKIRWAPNRREFFYTPPVLGLPRRDRRLVSLQRPPLRLLMTPTESVHDPSDMIGVVADLKLSLDQLRDPRRSPHLGSPPKGHRGLSADR